MSSKSQLNIINQILNIEGMTVTAYKVIDEIGYFIYLASNQLKAACPHCNNESDKLHQNHPLTVRDLPLGEYDNESDLNKLQKEKLIEIENILPELAAMHKMKELFRAIFESKIDWGNGLIKLGNWLKDAGLKFPKSCGTIKRWIGEIVAYFDNRTTQGVVEGINNKLKLIKRMGYGFRNFDNFQIRSLLAWHFNY